MLKRRYWPIIPIAAILVAASYLEWSHAHGPRQHTYAAAPQSAAPVASQAPAPNTPTVAQPQQQNPTQQPEQSQTSEGCTTHECREDAATETVALYTEVLAWFTGVLAIVSIGQGIFLWRADRTARISANAAKDAAEAALRQTNATHILERAELTFLPSGYDLAWIVSQIRAAPGSIMFPYPSKAAWAIFNNGKTFATLDSIRVDYRIGTEPFDKPPFNATPTVEFIDPTISSDRSTDHTEIRLDRKLTQADMEGIASGKLRLFLYGAISYRDIFDNKRETVFCVGSEPDGTFRPWGGKQYNYRT